jgi:hypothetical protein
MPFRKLPTPMLTAQEMVDYVFTAETFYNKGKGKKSFLSHFELIEQQLQGEFDSVSFCFTGLHRDWGVANKGLYAYGATPDELICAHHTSTHDFIEVIAKEKIRNIFMEKKLVKNKLIIETDEEEIQVVINQNSGSFIEQMLREILL